MKKSHIVLSLILSSVSLQGCFEPQVCDMHRESIKELKSWNDSDGAVRAMILETKARKMGCDL